MFTISASLSQNFECQGKEVFVFWELSCTLLRNIL
ncbi:unnamed protein product [Gulo gulo]|uniref:Uncharacterized protein n=1 Tax=Gulo gulo TaxID=48420 RepID=A0A9X9Q2V4_GULGU|nr:unnamed protein product [Gulo gulo]